MILPELLGGLPGNADALVSAARSLRDQANALSGEARRIAWVAQAGHGDWTGAASDMWRHLGATHGGHVTTSASALADAASTLDTYARTLEDAQRAHTAAIAEAAALRLGTGWTLGTGIPQVLGVDDELQATIYRAEAEAGNAAADAAAAARIAAAAFREIAGRAPADLRAPPPALPPEGGQRTPNEDTLALLLGSVRIGADGKPVRLNLDNPASLRGADPKEIDRVARAEGREAKPAKQGGGGMRYFTPGTNDADGIRVMNGDPKAPAGIKTGPYAIVTKHGTKARIPLRGNPELNAPGGGAGPWASGKPPTNTKPTGPVQTPGKSPGGGRGTSGTPRGPIRITPRLPW